MRQNNSVELPGMNKRSVTAIVIAAAFLGVSFYPAQPVHAQKAKQSQVTGGASAAASSPAGTRGHEHPGKAQPAGTTKEEDSGDEVPSIEISPENQRLVGIRTASAAVKPLQKIIRTVGRVEYDERRTATINAKVEGWIEKLYVDSTGRYLEKGERLAEIYSPDLIAAQQEFLNAVRWTRQPGEVKSENIRLMLSRDAERMLQAARQRLKLWDLTDEQISNIEATGTPVRTVTIFSTVSGNVVQKMAVAGMKVMPGEKLFDIADLSTVWIVSDIYENESALIKPGMQALISLSSVPGSAFNSTVDYVYPELSGATRTAKVRFVVPNPGGRLKPQMFTTVEVKISLGRKLAIPEGAVIDTGSRQVVYVDKGDGNFEPREVVLGLRADGQREVLRGLKAGEKVAASSTFLVDSEAQLRGVTPLEHKH